MCAGHILLSVSRTATGSLGFFVQLKVATCEHFFFLFLANGLCCNSSFIVLPGISVFTFHL